MDPSFILSATLTVIKGVDNYALSVKDAPESCKLFKAELLSIQKILIELYNLVKAGNSDVPRSMSNWSRYAELTFSQGALIRQLRPIQETLNYPRLYLEMAR